MFKLLLGLVAAACLCGGQADKCEAQSANQDQERYAVYSVVLDRMFVRESTKLLVIQDKTGDDFTDNAEQRWENIRKKLAPISQKTIEDFKSRNSQPSSLENKFTLTTKVTFISKSEVDKMFGKGGGWWEAFYKRYPNSPGLITLSNIGFNSEMTEALLYVGHGCGGLCGQGNYVLLVKTNGTWRLERQVMTWIS